MAEEVTIVEQLKTGGDRNFSYLITDRRSGSVAVVDPSYDPGLIVGNCRQRGLRIEYLINTHGHPDHINGNETVISETGARTVGHPLLNPDVAVTDGGELKLGETLIHFIYTPGHTADGICILAGNYLMTGDTLFVGKIGGTRIGRDARLLYDSLHQKILTLPDETIICPGHDFGVTPTSTVRHEKMTNPFILQNSFDEFQKLKRNWLEYKKIHGIK